MSCPAPCSTCSGYLSASYLSCFCSSFSTCVLCTSLQVCVTPSAVSFDISWKFKVLVIYKSIPTVTSSEWNLLQKMGVPYRLRGTVPASCTAGRLLLIAPLSLELLPSGSLVPWEKRAGSLRAEGIPSHRPKWTLAQLTGGLQHLNADTCNRWAAWWLQMESS